MNEEIKKILDYLKNNTFIPDETKRKYKILHRDEVNKLLNYITNLQEENKKLKETNEEHRKINGDLRKENKELKEKVDQYENPDDYTLFYMWLDTIAKDKMKQMEHEVTSLKQHNAMITKLSENIKQENQKLVNVIEEIEKYCKEEIEEGNKMPAEYERYGLTDYIKGSVETYKRILNKLTELKGGSDE